MGAPELVEAIVIFAFDLVASLLGAIPSLLARILRLALEVLMALFLLLFSLLNGIFRFLVNLLFGWLKNILDDMEKANLLLEYEKLLKRKKRLSGELKGDSMALGELVDLIDELMDAGFEQRVRKRSAESLVESFDVGKLSEYDEIKERALDYERVVFRCFVVRQKLKLHDMDGRLHEAEK